MENRRLSTRQDDEGPGRVAAGPFVHTWYEEQRWSAPAGGRRRRVGQRQRVVIAKPISSRPKPISRFQCSMPGIGYAVWLM